MSASSLVTAAETAVDKARAARCAAEEAMSAARMAELLAREALEAAKRTRQLERRAEEERRRRGSELSLSSLSSCSPSPLRENLDLCVEDNDRQRPQHSGTFLTNSPDKADNYKQMKTKYESMSEGLNILLRKCNNFNNHEKKPLDHDHRKNMYNPFAEFEDYDDNQNCRGLQSVKKSPTRKSALSAVSDASFSPTVDRNHINKEISIRSADKDEAKRNVPSTTCDNCRLSGMCLHGRYLERVMTKTEGMRVRAVGASWDGATLGRVGQVAGGGPGGRVRIRWAWQSGVGGDAWRRLETHNLSWRGEFSFQFWCRDLEQAGGETHTGRVIDLVPRH